MVMPRIRRDPLELPGAPDVLPELMQPMRKKTDLDEDGLPQGPCNGMPGREHLPKINKKTALPPARKDSGIK